MTKGTCCIHWFRKGLRLSDNPALLAAVSKHNGLHLELRPVYIMDPWYGENFKVGDNRWRFLIECLNDIDAQLRTIGTRLFVFHGSPGEVFKDIFKQWDVKKITFETDTEPYSVTRDKEITDLAKTHNVEVLTKLSHTLFDPAEVLKANKGATPMTYQKFLSVSSAIGDPPKPVEALQKALFPQQCAIQDKAIFDDTKYNVPKVEDVTHDFDSLLPSKFPGGETEGLKRLKLMVDDREKWVRSFEKPKTSPNSLEPSTTVLSPYLKYGCVSCRDMYWRLHAINSRGKHSNPPVSLVGQLMWREFFYTCGATIKHFNKMKGNKHCRQIPWREDDKKEEFLAAWRDAKTGYPYIDAIMTQLKKDGWIHHLARHSVACFLTRGDLWVSWEEGMAVFEELLLDADWSLNAGNWQWLSASAFFHQYYRVYSPIAFGKKTDPNGTYIKKWLPKLAKFPTKYIYEPWNAPLEAQKRIGCVIGKDYPRPIVKHDIIYKENLAKMKSAYSSGSSPQKQNDVQKSQKPPKKRKSESSPSIAKYLKKK